MKVYIEEIPSLQSQATPKLPCIVLTAQEAEEFVGEDPARRNELYDEARALAEQMPGPPDEVIVFCPRGEVVTGIAIGYSFVSSEVIETGARNA